MNKYHVNTERPHVMNPSINYTMKVETELPFEETYYELTSLCHPGHELRHMVSVKTN